MPEGVRGGGEAWEAAAVSAQAWETQSGYRGPVACEEDSQIPEP